MMPSFWCALFLVGVLSGCVLDSRKPIDTGVLNGFERSDADAKDGLGHCRVFGAERLFLDCLIEAPGFPVMQAVLEVGILEGGRDLASFLKTDRRVSGESTYEIETCFRIGKAPARSTISKGLPGRLAGTLYRGQRGGWPLVEDVTLQVKRELYWSTINADSNDVPRWPFFAFLDGPAAWAVPISMRQSSRNAILSLKILDRLGRQELEALLGGTVISFGSAPAPGEKAEFAFLSSQTKSLPTVQDRFPFIADISQP